MQNTFELIVRIIITYLTLIGPIILVLYLINLSSKPKHPLLRRTSYSLVTILFSLLFLLGLIIQNYRTLLIHFPSVGKTIVGIHTFSPHTIVKFYLIGPSIWFPSLIALCILHTGIRRRLTTFLPITATSSLHALTLSLSMIIPIAFLINVILGIDHLSGHQSELEILLSVWTQDVLLAITALIGVGWISRNSFKESLARLGLNNVTAKQIRQGLLMGLFLSLCVLSIEIIAANYGLIDPKVTKSTDELIGPLFHSFFGVLTLGLAAAIGEETLFRGALLPRFGLLYSSLLFALIHIHYGLSINLFIVFILGLILGIIRNKYNTTISMVVHATYNIAMGLIAYISIKLGA